MSLELEYVLIEKFQASVKQMREVLMLHKTENFVWRNVLNAHNASRPHDMGGSVNEPIAKCLKPSSRLAIGSSYGLLTDQSEFVSVSDSPRH